MEERNQVRLTRAKWLMHEAFLTLLEQKSFYTITVKDIISTAGVSRSVFYLHYEDKYALLDEMKRLLLDNFGLTRVDLQAGGPQALIKTGDYTPDGLLAKDFEYIEKHHRLFKALMGPNGDGKFYLEFRDYIASYQKVIVRSWGVEDFYSPLAMRYMANIISGAYVGIFLDWLAADMQPPAATMGKLLAALIAQLDPKPIDEKDF